MAPRQYPKGKSPHPGVVLTGRERQSGITVYRARYVDPDTGAREWVKLDPTALTNAEQRRAWAITKSKALARRKMELESGAVRASRDELSKVVDRYFEAHGRLSARTQTIYRTATDKLEAWAKKKGGVQTVDDLTRAKLLAFREQLIREPKRAPRRQGKRGTWARTAKPRSAAAVNQELRSVRTVLGYLHDLDLLPRLSFDDLRRALKVIKAPREAPAFLTAAECRQLLLAAHAHDAETYTETREEHAGLRQVGSTPRFEPVARFLAFVLLTGMRCGEALNVQWSYVDLDTVDGDGGVVGEIKLPAKATKTRQGRTVGLDVCPTLRSLLMRMKASKQDEDVFVFGGTKPMTRTCVEAARKRLIADFGAPAYSWQLLRSTTATVQCNAPSLWGTAAPFVSAKRLGHSVAVSEARYSGQLSVPRNARTLEAAMSIDAEMAMFLPPKLTASLSDEGARPRGARRPQSVSGAAVVEL